MGVTNLTFGYPRHTPRVTPGAWTGSWQSAWPISNLKSLPLGRVARSASRALADTKFEILLPDGVAVGIIGLINHNASNDATVTVQAYGDTLGTNLLWTSSALEFWPAVYATDDLEFEDLRWWDGKYADYEKLNAVPKLQILIGQNLPIRLVRFAVNDPNNADGYFQLGFCELATAKTFTINFAYGAQYGLLDRSVVLEAEGGAEYVNRRGDLSFFRGEIDYLPRAEARATILEMQRQFGREQPFLVLPFPDDPTTWLTHGGLMRFAGLDPLSMELFGHDKVPLNLKEVR